MKVGDLIKSKTRYAGQTFLVVDMRTLKKKGPIKNDRVQAKAIRMPDGYRTRWCNIETWEIVSESR